MTTDHKTIAQSYKLWREKFGATISEAQFNRMSIDHRLRLLREAEAFA